MEETKLMKDTLRYGEVLTDDQFKQLTKGKWGLETYDIRIRIIKYGGAIYYNRMINGEVVEFKELI